MAPEVTAEQLSEIAERWLQGQGYLPLLREEPSHRARCDGFPGAALEAIVNEAATPNKQCAW